MSRRRTEEKDRPTSRRKAEEKKESKKKSFLDAEIPRQIELYGYIRSKLPIVIGYDLDSTPENYTNFLLQVIEAATKLPQFDAYSELKDGFKFIEMIKYYNEFISAEHMKEHNYYINQILGPHYMRAPTPDSLRAILFPYQRISLQAMIDIETSQNVVVKNSMGVKLNIKTNSGVLSDPVGSGKTIVILSLLLARPSSENNIVYSRLPLTLTKNNFFPNMSKGVEYRTDTIITKTFDRVSRANLVLVGASFLEQWKNSIIEFTNLTFLEIHDVYGLRKLVQIIIEDRLDEYDIILCKNGRITAHLDLSEVSDASPELYSGGSKKIAYLLGLMNRVCFNRFICDDFDVIGMPTFYYNVNAGFYWYISTTFNCPSKTRKSSDAPQELSDNIVLNPQYSDSLTNNMVLFHLFNVRNSENFVSSTNNLPDLFFYKYTAKNKDEKFIGIIGSIGDTATREVMEALYSGAVETAAQKIGIEAKSVEEIFKKILGNKYFRFTELSTLLKHIDMIRELDLITDDDYKFYKKRLIALETPEYMNNVIIETMKVTEIESINEKKKLSVELERLKSNLSNDDCPLCFDNYAENKVRPVVFNCCKYTCCETCCFGIIFKDKAVVANCCNCRNDISMDNLLYIGKDFDKEKIINEDMSFKLDIKATSVSVELPTNLSKTDILLGIIKGDNFSDKIRSRFNMNVYGLMRGKRLIENDSKIRKVIVFANFNESLRDISKTLKENKVNYLRLYGKYSEIAEQVAAFKAAEASTVLLVNSITYCSGLNLQFATDIVFYHKISNDQTESQAMGRGQRVGRTNSLRVHYILYSDEEKSMTNLNKFLPYVEVEAGVFDPKKEDLN